MNDIHNEMTLADAAKIARHMVSTLTGDERLALTMLADAAMPSPDTPHGCTIGDIPARYVHGPGRYHAFALDARHLYEIGCQRKDALTTACFKIDGVNVVSVFGANFAMIRRCIKAMAPAIMVYKAKSHRNSKEWRKRKRAARKAEKLAAAMRNMGDMCHEV